jgi:hypothetical protein
MWSGAVTNREMLSVPSSTPFTRKVDAGRPIRSIPPSRIPSSKFPASSSANLMLDEPLLIVRMLGLTDLVEGSFAILQSERY